MLSRLNRFHGHGSVRRVYRLGRPARIGLASIHVLRSDKIKHSKVSVVVSRKVNKSAVARNRIRRRIYEIVRLQMPKFKEPAEIVITVYQPDAASMPADKLQAALAELFAKARL